MIIYTTRFGQIDAEEAKFIAMERPILGFDGLKQYILFPGQGNSPLWWLQSVQDPAIAFAVVDPVIIKSDYNPEFPDEVLGLLEIKKIEDIVLLTIVTSCSEPFRITANLKAPLLVNVENGRAGQIILDDPDCPIQYDIVGNKAYRYRQEPDEQTDMRLLDKIAQPVVGAVQERKANPG
jgi:flagellar assembly factor FliW